MAPSPAPRDLLFRRAKDGDLVRLVEIHLASYPDPQSVAARERNFTTNPFGTLDDLVVVEERGEIVGHAFLFRFRAFFGGAAVRVGGIASVGVAPEARGRGIATSLMTHLHRLSARRGDALTMLYGFRQGFYARLGYAPTASRKRLAIDTRSVPASWRRLARDRVRGARSGDERVFARIHAQAAARATGWIARSSRFWEHVLARETRMWFVCERVPSRAGAKPLATGYVAFSLVQERLHAETILEVEELIAEDDETRRALLGALAAMRDQVSEIVIEVALTDPLEHALLDGDGRRFGTEAAAHVLGDIVGGPMVRVEDPARALTARGYSGNGSFAVVISPDEDGGDAVALSVRVRDGRARVARAERRGTSRALRTSPAGLAAILYGGSSAADVVALGLAEADAHTIRAIDALAQMPPFTPIDAF